MSMDKIYLEIPPYIKGIFARGWHPTLTEGKEQVKTFYLLWTFVMNVTNIFLILFLLFEVFPLLCPISLG